MCQLLTVSQLLDCLRGVQMELPPRAERGVMGTSACVIQGCCSAASAVILFSGSHSMQPCNGNRFVERAES